MPFVRLKVSPSSTSSSRLQGVGIFLILAIAFTAIPACAQSFRFTLRAEPDVIAANGYSTSTIVAQVRDIGSSGISAVPLVHFTTTRGVIEQRTTTLSNGIGRVLLRSTNTPGTAVVTARIGNMTEDVVVEFTDSDTNSRRYIEIAGPYISYGAETQAVAAAGRCTLDLGEVHVESDVRMDVDLNNEKLWAEGTAGKVIVRHGRGDKAKTIRGDRLFYDLRRRRGVMRRSDTTDGPGRQEFMGDDFAPIPNGSLAEPAQPGAVVGPKINEVIKVIRSSKKGDASGTSDKSVAITPAESAGAPKKKTVDGDASAAISPAGETEPDAPAVEPDITVLTPQPAQPEAIEPNEALQPQSPKNVSTPDTPVPPLPSTVEPPAEPTKIVSRLLHPGETENKAELAMLPPAGGETSTTTGSDPVATVPVLPGYQDLPASPERVINLMEPLPPTIDNRNGYWVVAKRMRYYAHDQAQFDNARLFYNGGKVFAMPHYVVPLNGAFNATTDMVAFRTDGGFSVNIPYYYMASPSGTGAISLLHAPRNGTSANRPGFSLMVKQQYFVNRNSQGTLLFDQIGQGAWNMEWNHRHQFSPTMTGALYFDMPEHRDAFLRSTLDKEFRNFQIGLEGFFTRPEDGKPDMRGQFYARMRPRRIGQSGWTYNVAANFIGWKRYTEYFTVGGTSLGPGFGIGLPGNTRPGETILARTGPLYGQTLSANLYSPQIKLWSGAGMRANLATSLFNYSNGRRGVSPVINLGFEQRLGRSNLFALDYTYDRGNLGLYGSNFSHYVTSSLYLSAGRKLGFSGSVTKSLADHSLFAVTAADFYPMEGWRLGLFSNYSQFPEVDGYLNYGLSVGRMVGRREISVNWDRDRDRIYFQFGNLRY